MRGLQYDIANKLEVYNITTCVFEIWEVQYNIFWNLTCLILLNVLICEYFDIICISLCCDFHLSSFYSQMAC